MGKIQEGINHQRCAKEKGKKTQDYQKNFTINIAGRDQADEAPTLVNERLRPKQESGLHKQKRQYRKEARLNLKEMIKMKTIKWKVETSNKNDKRNYKTYER